jgi:hypothetical protein
MMVVKARFKNPTFKDRLNIVRSKFYDVFKKKKVAKKEVETPETKLRELICKMHVLLKAIDEGITRDKILTRQQKKNFWADFFKHGRFREDVFQELIEKQDISNILEGYKCDLMK